MTNLDERLKKLSPTQRLLLEKKLGKRKAKAAEQRVVKAANMDFSLFFSL